MMVAKRIAATAMLIVMLFVTAACGTSPETSDQGPTQEGPVYGGEVVIVAQAEPESFDPHKIQSAPAKEVLFNIYQGLVGTDTNGTIIPLLAENWDVSDDNLEYTFKLRSDVKFHDGTSMTSADVLYSLERMMDENTGHPYRKSFAMVERVEAQDELTVVIKLAQPDAPLLANLALVTSAIVPEGSGCELADEPVGTGPFELDKWNKLESVELVNFGEYWEDGMPYLDKVTFRTIKDSFTALQALRTGNVDVVPRIENGLLPDVESDAGLKLLTSPQNLVQLMAVNNLREPFNNVMVRQALNYAVNKQEIIEGVLNGRGTEIASNMSPVMSSWYEDLTGHFPHNPDKARELLAEAGYPNGFKATLSVPNVWQQHIDTCVFIKSQLEDVGVEVDIEEVEWNIWLERIYMGRDYDLTVIAFDGRLDPHQLLDRYASDYPNNFVNFFDEEYDDLLEQGVQTVDPEARRQIYHRLQQILAERAASVYIQDMDMVVAINADVEGWKFYPIYVIDAKSMYKK